MGALERISVAAIGTSIAELEGEVARAEAAGIECVWAPELFRAADTQAAYLAAVTKRIGIGTGIAWAFTRSPFIHAISALDIDEMSGGRFRLGLGAGVKRLNETWHNAEYGRPAPHLREAIEATRLIMCQAGAGSPIRYQRTYYDIDMRAGCGRTAGPRGGADLRGGAAGGYGADGRRRRRRADRPPDPEPALDRRGRRRGFREGAAALRPRARRLRLPADGLLRDRRRRGAGAGDGAADDLLLRDGPHLRAAMELHGFGDQALEAGAAFRRGDLAAVPAAISDEMVETYCAAGPLDKVRARVAATADRADGLFLTPPTYFISPAELGEFQARIVAAFGPGA